MTIRKRRKIPINSSKRNTCGVRGDGTPIQETDVRELVRLGLIHIEPMNDQQKKIVQELLGKSKS